MSQNATLLSDVRNFLLYAGQMTGAQFDAAFQSLLYEWAGASNIDPTSRGTYIDARHLAVVYAYYGIDPTSQPAYALNPNSHTGPQWESIYQGLVGEMEVRFASRVIDSLFANGIDIASLQSNPFVALSDIGYDPTTDDISVDLDELVSSIVSRAPSDATAAANYYGLTFKIVGGLSKDLFSGDKFALANTVLADLGHLGQSKDVEKIAVTAFGLNAIDEDGATGSISITATKSVVFLGAGDKTITGGSGNLYVYSANSGNDVVTDTSDGVRLVMSGADTTNVIMQADGSGDLIVKRLDTGASITFAGDLGQDIASRTYSYLSTISFGGGTTWTLPENLTFTWIGTATNTTLTGTAYGTNVFEMGPGGDVVNAKTANDLFEFGKGDGQAIVNLDGGGKLKMGAGITASDVILQSNADDDLIIKLADTGDSVTLVQDLGKNIGNQTFSRVGEIDFADGTTLDLTQSLTFSWTGTSTDTTLVGSTFGSNVFDLGAGGDSVTAGSATDVFEFDKGDGQASVVLAGGGTVRMAPDVARSDVILQADASGDLVIKLGDTGDSITLLGDLGHNIGNQPYSVASAIEFADGSSINLNQPLTFSYAGTATDTTLVGSTFGSNVFDLGPGGDIVTAGSGTDEFDFDKGDGQATVTLDGGGIVKMAADVAASDVMLLTDAAGDLTIKLQDSGDSITLLNDLGQNIANQTYSVASAIEFADGSSINLNQPLTFTAIGTAEQTTLVGSRFGSNVFDLGPGGDTVTATTSNDVFEFEKGDGQSTVTLHGGGTVKMAADIAPSDVLLQADPAGDLTIKLRDTGDSITLLNDLNINTNTTTLATIVFADGTTWDSAAIGSNLEIVGTQGNASISMPQNGATVDLGPGDDSLSVSGNGSDRIVFAKGDGHDTLNNSGSGYNRNDTLVLADINPGDVQLSRSSDVMTLTVSATGATFTVDDQFWGDGSQIQGLSYIQFADGTVWDRATIDQTAIEETPGYTVSLGAGDLSITSDGKQHGYVYTTGGGNDVIDDANSQSTLEMQDIASTGVTLSRNEGSYDLVLTVTSTGKTVTLKNEFNPYDGGVAVTFSDGVSWTTAQIEQLLLNQESAANGGSVYGYDGRNDTLVAGLGDKYLNGEGATDTYVYTSAGGNDIVDDSSGTLEMQDIASTGVTLSRDGGSYDLVLTVTSTGKTVTLKNEFSPYDSGLNVTFSDGVSWTTAQIEQLLLNQESAANGGSVYGYDGRNDTLVAGLGDKYLNGEGGTDTYIYTSAGGNDVVDDSSGTLEMQDIASTGVSLSRATNSYDLVLTVTSTGKTVTIKNEFSPYNAGLTVAFSDGVSWSPSDIATIIAQNTSGYIFNVGDGDVTVSSSVGSIKMGANISASDILIQADTSGDLILRLKNSSDVLTIQNDLVENSWGVSTTIGQVELSDGSVLAIGPTGPGQSAELAFTWQGTSSNTTLAGSDYGANVFDVGPGSDSITFGNKSSGGSGDNTIAFAEGDGAVRVNLNGGTGEVDFGAGIAASNLVFQTDGSGDLTIGIAGGTDSIQVNGDLVAQGNGAFTSGIDELKFSDGTVEYLGSSPDGNGPLTFTWLANASWDTLTGSGFGSNVYDVTASRAVVNFPNNPAVGGTNVINYAAGSGFAQINLDGGTGELDFGAGITSSNLYLEADGSGDLTFGVLGSSDTIQVNADLAAQTDGTLTSGIDKLKFSDGTVEYLGSSPGGNGPLTFTWLANASWDTLAGSGFGSNVYDITANRAVVDFPNKPAVGGTNVINYTAGSGLAQINLNGGTGEIDFGNGVTESSLVFQADSAGDLTIGIAGSSDSIQVSGDLVAQGNGTFTSGIEKLKFSDGTVEYLGSSPGGNGPLTFTWLANASWDTLAGSGFGSNVYDITASRAVVNFPNSPAVGGTNVINYAAGSGFAQINLNGGTGEIDFGTGVTESSLVFQADSSGDLTIGIAGSSDSIQVNGDLVAQGNGTFTSGIEKLKFSDGTVEYLGSSPGGNGPLTFTWLANASWDTLAGSGFGSNVYDITANRALVDFPNNPAVGGTNVINYAAGSGFAQVNLDGGTGEVDFGSGITSSNLYLEADGSGDLTLGVLGSSDTIQINGDLAVQTNGTLTSGIDKLKFSDGTVEYLGSSPGESGLLTFTWLGNSNGYSLNGSNFGANVFDITAQNGSVTFGNTSRGGDGENTVEYAEGDGSLSVNLNGGIGAIDIGSGLTASGAYLQTDTSGDLIVRFGGDASDMITVKGDLTDTGGTVTSAISQIQFADGSSINLGQGVSPTFTWIGAANASMQGSSYGANIFEFGSGSESATGGTTVNGGNGNNTYIASISTGQATINANAASGSTNVLDFAGTINDEDLWFQQSGNDLKIDLIGTSTQVDVAGWFNGGSSQLQEITAGGLKLDSQVSQLVQAMATYSANNAGFDPTSSSITAIPNDSALQNAIGAAWHS